MRREVTSPNSESWISPRRSQPAADAIASPSVQAYILHDLLACAKLPLRELPTSHLVALEVPPDAVTGFEHQLLRLVCKIRTLGPHVAVIALPQIARHAQTELWVHRWNRLEHAPVQLMRTRVCDIGGSVPGLRLTTPLGKTFGDAGREVKLAAPCRRQVRSGCPSSDVSVE